MKIVGMTPVGWEFMTPRQWQTLCNLINECGKVFFRAGNFMGAARAVELSRAIGEKCGE